MAARRGGVFYSSPPTVRMFFVGEGGDEKHRHFLDTCNLCSKPLPPNRDIFMYRGDTPFCSKECRQEQIDLDDADEKRIKLSTPTSQQQKKNIVTSGATAAAEAQSFVGAVAAG